MDRVIAGRYRLLSPVGSGGMGTVWRGEDELLNRPVAVKELVLPAGLPPEEQDLLRERTRREARAAARLDSPHAVTVYDVVEQDGHPFLVMELVQAPTLAQVVKDGGPLPPARVAQIGLDVLSALRAAHAQGIVHRDVKPSNVLVCPDGRVVLSDFGIARTTGDASLTSTGLLLGSPAYISPERARGEATSPASDLWALGATLYTAVEGRPPYDTGDPLTTLTSVVAGEPPSYVLAGPLVPALSGLLARDPADRSDADAARAALAPVARGDAGPHSTMALPLPSPAPDVAPAPPVVARRPRRGRGALLAAALLLVAVAGVGGYLASSRGDDRSSATARGRTPSASTVAVPAGWQTYQGPGWSVRHPPGWVASTYKGSQQLRDPATRRTVRIAPASFGAGPLAALTTTAEAFGRTHSGYQQLALEQRGSGAVWELTYSDGGADLHAADHAVVLDGRGFTVFLQARASDWQAAQADLTRVLATLRAT